MIHEAASARSILRKTYTQYLKYSRRRIILAAAPDFNSHIF